MAVEQLINFPKGTLSFHSQSIFAYSPIQGVVIVNRVCLVSPEISKINCTFSGVLRYWVAQNEVCKCESIEYDTVVFYLKLH